MQGENRAHLITAQITGANNPSGIFCLLCFYMSLQHFKVSNTGDSYKTSAELVTRFMCVERVSFSKVLFWECSTLTAEDPAGLEGARIKSPVIFKVAEY